MGIREDQFAGLTPAAHAFLQLHQVPAARCTTCERELPRNLEVIDQYHGMFETAYPLHRHVLRNGLTADEFLQAAPQSSGPIHFLGLRVSDGTEFVWTEDEINEWI